MCVYFVSSDLPKNLLRKCFFQRMSFKIYIFTPRRAFNLSCNSEGFASDCLMFVGTLAIYINVSKSSDVMVR